ncbi:MAG: helicase, partial [Myxococcales bacterium]|nr:helicase [Myxococcales bacterium]
MCRIPDFRKLLEGSHVRLLAGVFTQLARDGRLDPAWMDRRIRHLDNDEGDIEALMSRISFVRTWTYISHHGHWVADPEHWQGLTRAIEDRLSDALHERLTQRFVDPRARSFSAGPAVDRPRGAGAGAGAVRVKRAVVPEADHPFRQLAALRLDDVVEQGPLADEAARIVEAPHEAFVVDARGQIRLGELAVANMSRGADVLRPEVVLTLADGFGAGAQAQVRRRMLAWTRDLVAELLAPLRAEAAGRLKAAGKGLVYQLEHGLGSLLRARCEAQVQGLDADDRKLCAQLKITVGALVVFVPALLEPAALVKRAALWSAAHGRPPALPAPDRVSVPVDPEVPASWYHAIGYPPFGPRAV